MVLIMRVHGPHRIQSQAVRLKNSSFPLILLQHIDINITQSCLTLCDPMDCIVGQNTGVDSLFLPWGIFPSQGSNPGLPHCRWILYQLSRQESPYHNLVTVGLLVQISINMRLNQLCGSPIDIIGDHNPCDSCICSPVTHP